MNKNEYLTRVFEGQISSLKREIENYEDEVIHLRSGLKEAELNLEQTKAVLKMAEEEMRKYR